MMPPVLVRRPATVAAPLAVSVPVMAAVLLKVAAPATDKACMLVLPPPDATVMPPADTARPPDAVSSPATDSVLLAAAPARMTRVLVLLVPSTVLPCTVRPPDRLRLVAVRLLCSSTGAVKLAMPLTVSKSELLAPMAVLACTLSAAAIVVGELILRGWVEPAIPMVVFPAARVTTHSGNQGQARLAPVWLQPFTLALNPMHATHDGFSLSWEGP